MIIITDLEIRDRQFLPEDKLETTLDNGNGFEAVIKREFKKETNLNWKAVFHFASEDGTSNMQHMLGVVVNRGDLPDELKNAIMVNDLPLAIKDNFARTCGSLVIDRFGNKSDISKEPEPCCKVCGERIYPYFNNDSLNGICGVVMEKDK